MQSNRTTPSRVAGTSGALLLLLLGILLAAATLYLSLSIQRPDIESDLYSRASKTLKEIGLTDENIKVSGQDVMLAGVVDTDLLRQKAEVRAASVYGVSRVFNNLRLAGEEASQASATIGRSADAKSDDQSLTGNQDVSTSVASQSVSAPTATPETNGADLVLDETLSPSTLDISVADGLVTVQGIVPDEGAIERIIAAVSGKFGVANVEDDMSTYVGSAKPRWLDGAIELIDQIDEIDNPFIRITHSGATVGGIVNSESVSQQKTNLAKQLLGNYLDVQSEFSVNDPLLQPPAREAKKRAAILRPATLNIGNQNGLPFISGIVNSEREAQAVRDGVNTLFNADYEDRLLVDDSVEESPWIAEAIAIANRVRGVRNFSIDVNNGQLQLSGDITDRISGRSLASAATDIAGNKLAVVNNFTPTQNGPIALSGEELLAEELQNELNALDTAAISFKKGSTTLTDEAKLILNDVADVIMTYRNQIVEIAGHTDSTGDALNNLELSRQRAIAVQEYLVDRQVPQARLSPIGYGETDPIADNLTPEGQARNRRIEFKL
ncbi:MAG: OmpA family protein [Pseudomonadota bacterium]